LGIFENLNFTILPGVYPRFTYVAKLNFHRSEVGKHTLRLAFIDQDGNNVLLPIVQEINVISNELNTNIILELINIQFNKPGPYEIDLAIDSHHIATNNINVLKT
jgi:hypothetical protein